MMLISIIACGAWFYLANAVIDRIFPARGPAAGSNISRANLIRPWVFLGPAILLLGTYLIYPVLNSIWLSLHDGSGDRFVGLDNYRWLVGDDKFRESLRNNLMWLVVVPAAATLLGLIAAGLSDRMRLRKLATSLIFMPMAISFVGASVIWKFVYDYRAAGEQQIGIVNAIVTAFGGEPAVWISTPFWNNYFLMVVLIWIQTGFAMVVLSAALRGIPEETIEAALLDGASPFQIFRKIKVPQIRSTIVVVWTTITILVLKVFDIVLAMTNGQWGTQVLANLMFDWMFRGSHTGRASAVALVIMILVIPIMLWNMINANRDQT